MLDTAFSPWPSFTSDEADAITRVLRSNRVNYWTGQEGRQFEGEFAEWCGVPHAVAAMNGTVALEAALRALGLGEGDEVIVTPRTFIASVSSVVATGASPVFADIDANSQNIRAETIMRVLSPRTKAILCVHLAGWPCEMTEINAIARDFRLSVVEDCAQAHGARYLGKSVGSLGDIAAWSFCQDKIMTTAGEGGMVTTGRESLGTWVRSYKDHGKNFKALEGTGPQAGFRWVHDAFGTNFRMPEIQAAVGRVQLTKMADWHKRRTANARDILSFCAACPALRVAEPPSHVEHAWYRAYAFVRPEALRADWSRDRIISEISALGVPCFSGSCSEVYLERAFEGSPFRPAERLPVARQLGETSLMFLVHPTLTEPGILRSGDAIRTVMASATR